MLCVIFAFTLAALPVYSQSNNVRPPCDAGAIPVFADPGKPPAIAVMQLGQITQNNWRPPACTGWASTSTSQLVVGVAGSFQFSGGIDDILRRMAAVSALKSVRYWSQSDTIWRPVATDASALSGPDPKSRRADFAISELTQGARLYYWENDSRVGEVVYRMTVLEKGPNRAVISSENATPIKYFVVTASQPGTMQTVTYLTRLSPNLWGLYILDRVGAGTSFLLPIPQHSLVNHTIASFRLIAGIRTDQEPPADP
jgi:hypothetical protein